MLVRAAKAMQQDDHSPILPGANDIHLLLRAMSDEFVRCGMRDACTSPGSRSTPIVLALAREQRLRAHSHIDERCAGFFALGLAKQTGRPVAVNCTSGTAAANLLPAVVEAHHAGIGLILLTADRPPELRDVGAGQTIDQLKLYGGAVRWFVEVGVDSAGSETWMRDLACRAYWTAAAGGSVHLNLPLREPLIPAEPVPAGRGGRPNGAPWLTREVPTPTPVALDLPGSARGLVVAGAGPPQPGLSAWAEQAGYPLLADPLSGHRHGHAAIANYDTVLRRGAVPGTPEVVIRIGDLPTCKPLRRWLADLDGVPQIAIGSSDDPAGVVKLAIGEGPLPPPPTPAPAAWLQSWRAADLAAEPIWGEHLSEPLVARTLGECLPAAATLYVAASMPIRDVESFWPARVDGPRVLANRGANGIDGTVSSAFGAAAGGPGGVVLLIGDVALAHDIGGLIAARRLDLQLTIVLLNNGGGAIFDFLAVAAQRDVFEAHVATPTGLDFADVARLYGFEHERISTAEKLRDALARATQSPGCRLLEVRTERRANLALHRSIWHET
ncbi:MAG: 2-succinyl-5-enolpyruvyl-6-hydroxy-3-cyclohexene-1-carboxylic-acid synthase [Solirubrobacteraceae bacterium]